MNPNVDPNTGIHYGVIPVTEFNPEIFYEECVPVYRCETCEHNPANDDDYPAACDMCENYDNIVMTDGMHLRLDENNDVWVLRSHYTTLCAPCSPCAPNAGYITDQIDNGLETYAPNPDWLREPEKFNIKEIEHEKI